MKIKIIGCGNAFSKKNFNQCIVLEENDRKMMIDCGRSAIEALDNAHIPISEIDDIYISHAHADHINSLEYVAFARYDWKNKPHHYTDINSIPYAPTLIANHRLMKDLWDKSLSGGLESMEGFIATIGTFFQPVPIGDNETFNWEGWKCELIQQVHIMTGSTIACTFGLFMSKPGKKSVYFTTDSQHCSPKQVELFYNRADIIIQDCECSPFMSGVHANYMQLAGSPEANSTKLSAEIKSKMWLSHYQDFVSDGVDFFGKDCNWNEKAKNDGFAGFVFVGKEFDI